MGSSLVVVDRSLPTRQRSHPNLLLRSDTTNRSINENDMQVPYSSRSRPSYPTGGFVSPRSKKKGATNTARSRITKSPSKNKSKTNHDIHPTSPSSPRLKKKGLISLVGGVFRPGGVVGVDSINLLDSTVLMPGASMNTPTATKKTARMQRGLSGHPSSTTSNRHLQHIALDSELLTILEFWRFRCPTEVTLKMLAFLGPSWIIMLQRTQRFIHRLLSQDVAWRVLCEELYKWKEGDSEPSSWKEHYCSNPCIPIDFSTISSALAAVGWATLSDQNNIAEFHIPKNVTLWLRPDQPHFLSRAISIYTLCPSITVTIRTMQTTTTQKTIPNSRSYFHNTQRQRPYDNLVMMMYKHSNLDSGIETGENTDDEEADNDMAYDSHVTDKKDLSPSNHRALLLSQTSRRNEPLFRVLRGRLLLHQLDLQHSSLGVDIWNGNAAIQIQPNVYHSVTSHASNSMAVPVAMAIVQQSTIQSNSGRGVVALDGGHIRCDDCFIHDCAATGVYIGGRGSSATFIRTDIWSNGTGNLSVGGIGRGHSGIYIEEATRVELEHCSIAYNTASGISMIGNANMLVAALLEPHRRLPEVALEMTHTSVLSNGCFPLDFPQIMRTDDGILLPGMEFPWQRPDNHNRIEAIGTPQAQSLTLRQAQKEQYDEQVMLKRRKKRENKTKKQKSNTSQAFRSTLDDDDYDFELECRF